MAKVKITVVKKVNNKDMFGDSPPVDFKINPECDRLQLGQEFIFNGGVPQGFCHWAFADIHRDLVHLQLGGSFPWIKEEGIVLSCCTDGIRPVIFKLERIQD